MISTLLNELDDRRLAGNNASFGFFVIRGKLIFSILFVLLEFFMTATHTATETPSIKIEAEKVVISQLPRPKRRSLGEISELA